LRSRLGRRLVDRLAIELAFQYLLHIASVEKENITIASMFEKPPPLVIMASVAMEETIVDRRLIKTLSEEVRPTDTYRSLQWGH